MNKNKLEYRLRIAPSPTGYPHIGTVYQALFNYAYAHKNNGKFIVRIEDTDRTRLVNDAEEVIFSALDWVGLFEDESPRKGGEFAPYRQSERLEIYHKYAQELLDKGLAFFDYYPKTDATGKKKDYSAVAKTATEHTDIPPAPATVSDMLKSQDWVLRMKVPDEGTITVTDGIRGKITFDYKQVSKQILLKSDGYPTYHLGVVVDDHLMQISHILRAEEWIPSLPKHVLLYQYFGWEMPVVYHTATLRNPDKSKLSKRQGHTNVNWFREEGYLPDAILNYLALLGWSHPEEKEIFSLQEFIEKFDLNDIRPIAPIFDLTKLTWMNQQYIQNMSDEELVRALKRFYANDPDISHTIELLETNSNSKNLIWGLVKTRMEILKQFKQLAGHFFQEIPVEKSEMNKQIAQSLEKSLTDIDSWNNENILSSLKQILLNYKIKMPVLYTIFTGEPKGLPLPESLVILGKDKTLARVRKYL